VQAGNNTAFGRVHPSKDFAAVSLGVQRCAAFAISGAMTDAEELIRRYLVLWQDYLTALSAEPEAAALLRSWTGLWSRLLHERRSPAEHETGETAGPSGSSPSGSQAGAAPAAGASVECDRLLAEFARRLARIEERVATVERGRRAALRSRSRTRRARS
jgi:hypothetical protein